MKKQGRYKTKVALGLVPHRYDRDRKGFGAIATGPVTFPPKPPLLLRKGRHRFVGAAA